MLFTENFVGTDPIQNFFGALIMGVLTDGWTDRYPLHFKGKRPFVAAALFIFYKTYKVIGRARLPLTIYCPWKTGYIDYGMAIA